LIGILAFVLYGPTLTHGFLATYDDPDYVTHNAHIQAGISPANILWSFSFQNSNWHPLTLMSHMLDCQLFGTQSWYPHLVNVALHAANCLFLLAVLQALTAGKAFWKCVFVVLLFALHPLNVESVAWVSERKNLLSTFFGLATLFWYARYSRKGGRPAFWSSVACFSLSLMAKPAWMTLPFLLLLLDFWPLGRLRPRRKFRSLMAEKIPFFLLGMADGVATVFAQKAGGSLRSLAEFGYGSRLTDALVAYGLYVKRMFLPVGLSVFYPSEAVPAWQAVIGAAFFLAVSWWAFRSRKKRPYLFTGWFWYVVTLVPVIGILQVGYQATADRYTYLPLIGLYISLVWGTEDWLGSTRKGRKALVAAGLAVCLVLGVLTGIQESYWKDGVTLYQHACEVTSRNWLAHNNLGAELDLQERRPEAIRQFEEAVKDSPQDPPIKSQTVAILGHALEGAGDTLAAEAKYEEALGIFPENPGARQNLVGLLFLSGNQFLSEGKIQESSERFGEAVRYGPKFLDVRTNFAVTLAQLGRKDEAIGQLEEAAKIKPDSAPVQYNLGVLLEEKGRLTEAAGHFQDALKAQPGYPQARAKLDEVTRKMGRS
jgi:Tfp pilus assembly protein PilF